MRKAHDCNWRDVPTFGLVCINERCPLHRAMRVLAENLRIAAFGAAMFKAGDNFGFHMGEDSSQCTCQWSPGRGVPYVAATRCESDCDDYDYDYSGEASELDDVDEPPPLLCCPRFTWGDEFHDPDCREFVDPYAIPGPNGCRCGNNGDCNCPFVASEEPG